MTGSPKKEAVGVSVQGLEKRLGGRVVLQDIHFEVQPGEVFVVMGPSGSGKSVLLKNIIGLEAPSAGRVLINGQDASDPRTHQKIHTALVFQSGALFQSMSVYDNLALYPREHRLFSEGQIRDKVMSVLKMLSLEHAAQQYPSELSGGMRKRVAIARVLVMEPQLILYDEPTSELDPIMASTISEIIATLKEHIEVTSIVVSHDVNLAFGIADRVALLRDGKLLAVNTPKEMSQSIEPNIKEFFYPHINLVDPRYKKVQA